MSEQLCVVVEMDGRRRTLYEGDTLTIVHSSNELGMTIKDPPIKIIRIGEGNE